MAGMSVLPAVQRERDRIASDLHDGTVQSLLATAMGLTRAARATGDVDARAAMERAVAQIEAAVAELRSYLHELQPTRRPEVTEALHALAEEYRAGAGVDVAVEVDATVAERVGPKAGDLVRMAREGLSNAVRHGRPSACRVRLRGAETGAALEVVDDGSGFDPVGADRHGRGLRDLRDRAARLGGRMEIYTSDGAGTRMRVLVPA